MWECLPSAKANILIFLFFLPIVFLLLQQPVILWKLLRNFFHWLFFFYILSSWYPQSKFFNLLHLLQHSSHMVIFRCVYINVGKSHQAAKERWKMLNHFIQTLLKLFKKAKLPTEWAESIIELIDRCTKSAHFSFVERNVT